ncbi:MAG: hypothetical protein QXT86_11345 [Archaeoglobaceae archaeon]
MIKQKVLAPNHLIFLNDPEFKLLEGPVLQLTCYYYTQPTYYAILDSILTKALKLNTAELVTLNLCLYEVDREHLKQLEKDFWEQKIATIYLYLPIDKFSEIPLLTFLPLNNA